jgi:hypothetical protein
MIPDAIRKKSTRLFARTSDLKWTGLTAFKNLPQAPALLVRGDRQVSSKGFSPGIGGTRIDSMLYFV